MKLFVYGTLRRGEGADLEKKGATFLRTDSISGHINREERWYPMLTSGEDVIPGEVFEVPEKLIPRIDFYEGAPDLFERRETTLLSGETASVYFYAGRL